MKKTLLTLLLSIVSLALSAQCTVVPTGGTVKAKTYKSCYDTVTVRSVLNTLDADTCTFTKITVTAPIVGSVTGNAATVTTNADLNGDVSSSGNTTTIGAGKVTNSMLFGSIAYSKLSLTGEILNADLAGSIAYSKLSLTNSVISGDIVSLVWSKLTSTPTTLAGYGITDAIATGGNAGTATTLQTGRTIGITGDINYTSPSFNGSANVTSIATLDTATAAQIKSVYRSYNVACWGNSLTFSDPGYPSELSRLMGTTVFNGGRGGDTSTQIKVRMLNDTSKYSHSVIICAGRNNFSNPTQVLADIAAMVAALGHTRYLVLSVPNGTAEPNPSTGYTQIMALNASLASTYGTRYVDFRAYLVSLYNPGIPQDVIDHANDVPPSSLRIDALHYTTNGYYKIAQYIYNNYLSILQPQVYKPINLNDVAKLLHNNSGANFKNFLTVQGGGDTSLINNELLTNGTFTGSLTGWTAGANWSSSSNTALHTAGSNATLTQSITTVGSSVYLFQITVSNYTAGTLTISLGSSLGSTALSANGTFYYSFYPSTTGSVTLTLQPTSSFAGNVDNASVKLITPYGSPVLKINCLKDSISPIEIRASQLGYYNWFFGGGRRNYNGTFNVGMGSNSLGYNTTGSANTAYGYNSVALNVSGSSNTGIGSNSMAVAVASSFCTSVGSNNMLALTSGTDNTAVGYNGSLVLTTGSYNNTFGSRTGNNLTTGTFNQIYGAYCTAPSATASGQLNIGNVIYGTNLYQTASASSTPTTTGSVGIGVTATSITARLHLPAGTATASTAPLKFATGGTQLTTPENLVVEPATGDANLLFTTGAGVRYTLSKTLTNTATLDFGSTLAGTATDLTITVTGAADGDAVTIGVPNGSTLADGCFTGWVSATNTVTVRFANNSLTLALDPASGTFRASVIKY